MSNISECAGRLKQKKLSPQRMTKIVLSENEEIDEQWAVSHTSPIIRFLNKLDEQVLILVKIIQSIFRRKTLFSCVLMTNLTPIINAEWFTSNWKENGIKKNNILYQYYSNGYQSIPIDSLTIINEGVLFTITQ